MKRKEKERKKERKDVEGKNVGMKSFLSLEKYAIKSGRLEMCDKIATL